MVRKYITINIENIKEHDHLVCKYTFKKGESLGKRCYVRNYKEGYCIKHFKLVQKYEQIKKIPKCQYKTKKGNCNRKCINKNTCIYHKINRKEHLINITKNKEKHKSVKLLCYYNDYKDKKQIENLVIKDNICINIPSIPLLICYNNDNTLFKKYISKLKKRIKKKTYKNKKKLEKKKINSNIKIEYFNEGKDKYGFPICFKRKSPFPNEQIYIDNVLYKNSYYEWKPVQKEVHLCCINIENNIKKAFIYSIKQFEEMLLNIYTEKTVNNYFGY